ncbi:MAG TPA: LLM class flavin-dependent oxidoreductase [Ohtaekwangia sp.]
MAMNVFPIMKIKLSVLDQTPIRRGSSAQEALQESIRLAKFTDQLGYTRYWVSEHHNIATLAGAAPEVLIARLAGETKNLRFGSGGVMLPNHSALKVAENFRLLEALYPGRIDLGIGRAPGGDRLTASLLNPSNTFNPKEYIQQLVDLKAFLADEHEAGTLHEKVSAIPSIPTQPELWMLTSSGESAYIAAHFGMALSFAQFINPMGGPEAILAYREQFRPSEQLQEPKASVGIFVFCGDTEEKAAQVQAVMDYRLLSIERGKINESPSYELVKSYAYSREELARVQYNRMRTITGTPDVVKERIKQLAKNYNVDEIVISTFADTFEDRLRSYELLAEMFLLPVNAF